MRKIGLFYGSDTGCTEEVADRIIDVIGEERLDKHDIEGADSSYFENYELLIFGISTWYYGELQSSWDVFLPHLEEVDFTGKTVAFYGLGDQLGYSEYFIDGVGILYDVVIENGAKVVGEWPIEDYDFDESVAEREGVFVGLALDEDNEPQKTDERLKVWLNKISEHFDYSL